ncbi:hypothetical protein [Kitasatospora camelliae]|uniref:Uncharacterized protein n=1 Tax=Kitasatospora camelliae TaxID=3156397 RepID=A0AAU8K4C8_9ACTN
MTALGPVTVSIDGLADPTTHPGLQDGLAALWAAANEAPIWIPSYQGTRDVLTSREWRYRIAERLRQDGRWQAPLILSPGTERRMMRIRAADPCERLSESQSPPVGG